MEETIKALATKDDIANLRKQMSENQAKNMKWMFIFWVGQIGAVLGMLLLFIKK